MNGAASKPLSLRKSGSARRRVVNMSQTDMIETTFVRSGKSLPLLIKPTIEGIDLVAWVARNRQFIDTHLLKYGGIIFRGFNISSVAEFEQLVRVLAGEMMTYTYRSTPRTHVGSQIYTSTEFPAAQSIPLHNEMSYAQCWPMKIWFCCLKAALEGGETPIADSRNILAHLDPKIIAKFKQKQVMYVRNYRPGLDLNWQDVFQTTHPSDVEAYCRRNRIECEWKDNDHLRTRQVCQAVATHPQTGEEVWFNQVHLFHVSSLEPKVRDWFLREMTAADLPRNAYYGDGSQIESSVLEEICRVYQQEAILFPWQPGDILMLDNMLVAHGRSPFTGSRQVVVGMADPFSPHQG